ncbi:MAG TPA: adenylate/guanylate cyclase domain-containing protein [Rhodospirillaceae bacterium]|nr:adenylate/guanylate cyclase domain-containing protein [Rhodospirillaceae bacterium]
MRIHHILPVTLLVLLNLLPAGGTYLDLWSWHQALYFYWAESVLIGAFIFITYAKHLFVFVLVLLPAIFLADTLEGNLWRDMKAQIIFWCIYSLYWLAYFELKYTRYGVRIHRLHPITQFILYLFFMAIGIAASFALTMTLLNEWAIVSTVPNHIYQVFLLIAVCVPTLVIGILKIIHMIGARHFLYFLLGTYHRPVEKQRVVLFLDMVGSSKMAETLEPKESMRLVASFIFDASAIIRSYGGDILNYTGDGLVVTWKLPQADKAIGCVYAMRRRFEKIRPAYQKEYGIMPYFRMGLHAGPVVIAQVGEEKLFLGLYGDTVNTASRLESLNKQLGTKVLVSGAVSQWISPKWTSRLEPKGLFEIQGRREMVDVYTLRITD